MNMPRRAAPASDLEVRIAALELIVEQLVATSMNTHPADWALFEDGFDDVCCPSIDDMAHTGLASALSAAAASDVLSILRAARKRADLQATRSTTR